MVDEEAEVEHFVAVVELIEEDVLFQVRLVAFELLPRAPGLLVEGFHRRGEASGQADPGALSVGERGAAVSQGIEDDLRFLCHGFSLLLVDRGDALSATGDSCEIPREDPHRAAIPERLWEFRVPPAGARLPAAAAARAFGTSN